MAADDVNQQPVDAELCMLCKASSNPGEDIILCIVCQAPWHQSCLISSRESHFISDDYLGCPECENRINGDDLDTLTPMNNAAAASSFSAADNSMVAKILAIQADKSLTEEEKARKRQELLSGRPAVESPELEDKDDGEKNKCKVEKFKGKAKTTVEASKVSDESINCTICLNMPERPVTTPCGHNFCLKCFNQSVRQGKRNCALCRKPVPAAMANQPRINLTLVSAIRMAKMLKSSGAGEGSSQVYEYIHNQDRPDKAYTTERAKRNGMANAASGRIFVTIPTDHFGPILAKNEPVRNRGVLVGDTWGGRLECRQWGGHFPPITGIAGQKNHGAQSVILSGGYIDDEDHGEWFLYTGSGGRDLSGNKRTNKIQSFDQEFKSANDALRLSCRKGYPLRVIRCAKDKHSSYAPVKGLRYDGIYRVEKCWRNVGVQGFKVCRYLMVRCDNAPAPWTSDVHGDRPRPLPAIQELERATDITERKESPSWDFDEADGCWKWMKPPPKSRQKEKKMANLPLLPGRLICSDVLYQPVTTACGHNFCKLCLVGVFAGRSTLRERNAGGRNLRFKKNVMKCPACPNDLADDWYDLEVNIELKNLIAKQMRECEHFSSAFEKRNLIAKQMRECEHFSSAFEKRTMDEDSSEDLSGNSDNEEEDEEGSEEDLSGNSDNEEGSEDDEVELKPEKPSKQRKVDDQRETN
ncbi:hypothetical protein GOBAR_AA22546 [Gossypium barbadense]|uniref:RING-type E3 ubiquitin transferase n=1 Tax=Gossypium barbadense TaxID=3634 RepID=A0A2P5X452_GOSBA|nr:hypothetical protein GOBAR_AA22546 [Gossypium barbadense]